MRLCRTFILLAVVGCATPTSVVAQTREALKVGFTEVAPRKDEASDCTPQLASTLAGMGVKARDLTPDLDKGALAPGRVDVLILGAFTNREEPRQIALARSQAALRAYVHEGGSVVIFPQYWVKNSVDVKAVPDLKDAADRNLWGFLLPEFELAFSPQHGDSIVLVDAGHPLVSSPNVIRQERFAKWSGCWPLQIDPPFGVVGTKIVVGHRYILAWPWLQEVDVGRGHAFAFGGALDRMRESSTPEHKALLGDILTNVFERVQKLKAKDTPTYAVTMRHLPHETKEAVLDQDDWKAFEGRVNVAVDAGVVALKKMQKKDGSWGTFKGPVEPTYFPVGQTALAVMALIGSGVSKYEPEIERAIEFLVAHPPASTYECGLVLTALDQYGAPDRERFEILRLPPAERLKFVYKRRHSPAQRELMERCLNWLLGARIRGVWSYLAYAKSADLSNTQYGALGLLSARRSGLNVPTEAFDKILETFLANQAKLNGTRPYSVAPINTDPHAWPKFEDATRGLGYWGYDALARAKSGARGTLDGIGIACLMLALDGVTNDAGADHRVPKVRTAVDMALNQIDSAFRADIQGGNGEHFPDFYYLYTIERAMTLLDERFIGRHDWYREAAEVLCDLQRKGGEWDVAGAQWRSSEVHTCFALLTLRRATPPSRTTLKSGG